MQPVLTTTQSMLVAATLCGLASCGGGGSATTGGGGGAGGGSGGGGVNQPPSFTSATELTFAENELVSFTLEVTDPDSATVTIREVAGGDSALFVLDPQTGGVTANTPDGSFDFETPVDSNADNVYEQDVELSDGDNTVTATVSVTITNVDEGPEFTPLAELPLNENGTGVIVSFTAVDPEGADVGDYQVFEVTKLGEVVNADRLVNAFSIDAQTGELSVVVPFDAEIEGTQDTINVAVSASDGALLGFGGVSIRIVDLPSRLSDGVRISGEDEVNTFADTAAHVGDLDGDGIDEVFVAAASSVDGIDTGYLLWGQALRDALMMGGSDRQITDLAVTERVVFTGDDRANTGRVSRLTGVDAGDVDNDGFDDLLILMRRDPNSADPVDMDNGPLAYLIWGSALDRGVTDSVSLTALPASDGVALEGLARRAAIDVVGASADFDGDNRSDVVLGLPEQNRTLVVFGDALATAGTRLGLDMADSTQAVELVSELTDLAVIQQSGRRVATVADMTSDGTPELVISGEGLEPDFQSGAFIVSGSLVADAKGTLGTVNLSADENDTRVVQATVADVSVESLAGDGDADADGLPDLAIGHRGNFSEPRIASVVYGATLATTLGTSDELSLDFASATDGAAVSDVGSSAAQTVDVDPVVVRWIGNADGASGDELMVAVPNASPLGRTDAGQLYVFTQANLQSGGGDLRVDSTSPDAAQGRVLLGYGTGVRTGRELFVLDLDGDQALEIGSGSALAASEAAQQASGGLVIFPGTIVGDAIDAADGASDLATTVVVEAP